MVCMTENTVRLEVPMKGRGMEPIVVPKDYFETLKRHAEGQNMPVEQLAALILEMDRTL